jgi:putative aldouronate transport system permease protein
MLNEIRQRHNWFKRVTQTLSYLPHFAATVVIVGLLYDFFAHEGIVNTALSALGLEKLKFLSDPDWFRPLYIGSGIWQGVGWGSIVYLAALMGIDQSLYESAAIDGANRWQQLWHITLPGIVPTVRTLLILNTARIVSISFEKAYLMQQPGTYRTSDVIATYVYRRGIQGLDFSFATAVGLVNSVVSIVLLLAAHFTLRRISEEGLW